MRQWLGELFVVKNGQYDVDICRVVFYSLMLWWFCATRFESYADVPTSLYNPPEISRWLHLPPPSLPWIALARAVWLASLALSGLGLLTGVASWLAFLLGFYLLGLDWSYGNTHHSHHLLVICLFVLACARCSQRLSLDRWLSSRFRRLAWLHSDRLSDETWSLRICQLSWCLMFFNAGLAKVRHSGWDYFNGANFHNILLITHQWYARELYPLNESLRNAVYNSSLLAGLLGGSGLLFELLSPLAFLLRNRWRWLIVVGIAALQVGAYLLFYISGFKKITAAYVFWIPWTSLYRRLRPQPEPLQDSGAAPANSCNP